MKRHLKAGDLVEVRSREEILATLDEKGRLENLPFMPQMFQYCGQRFRVASRAHKTCDTVFPVRGRRVGNTVHLNLRCDGEAYGGCQAGCLIFWKESWLRKVQDAQWRHSPLQSVHGCTEEAVWAATRVPRQPGEPIDIRYRCQATELPNFSTELKWWDVRQYVEDYTSGNVGIWRLAKGLIYSAYYQLTVAGIGVGRLMRWFYDTFHPVWRGTPFPRKIGTIPRGEPTPNETIGLQPGDLVRVKSHAEILRTVNVANQNRGLYFDAEMVPYCGGTYRVLKRVSQILDEKTGKMVTFKTPAIVLEDVVCRSRFSECRLFCPRAIYSYWREIWLERVSQADVVTSCDAEQSACGSSQITRCHAVKV